MSATCCTDELASAHYVRAHRYKRKSNMKKHIAHLRRGDLYARMSAFGIELKKSEVPSKLLVVSAFDDGNAPAVAALAWRIASDDQATAIDTLLAAEFRGDRDTNVAAAGTWVAYRHKQTGGLYLLRFTGDAATAKETAETALLRSSAPRDALSLGLMLVEDWRYSMLMIKSGNGKWACALPYQAFAYYDFILNEHRDIAKVKHLYANRTYVDRLRRDKSDTQGYTAIPDCFFEERQDADSGFFDLAVSLASDLMSGIASAFQGDVEIVSEVYRVDNTVCFCEGTTRSNNVRIQPASLVHDGRWEASVPMTYNRARLILGLVRASPSAEDVCGALLAALPASVPRSDARYKVLSDAAKKLAADCDVSTSQRALAGERKSAGAAQTRNSAVLLVSTPG